MTGSIHAPESYRRPVTAQVDVTELMGSEIFIYLVSGSHQLLARVDPRTQARLGEQMDLVFDMANVHAFDPTTEQSLLL